MHFFFTGVLCRTSSTSNVIFTDSAAEYTADRRGNVHLATFAMGVVEYRIRFVCEKSCYWKSKNVLDAPSSTSPMISSELRQNFSGGNGLLVQCGEIMAGPDAAIVVHLGPGLSMIALGNKATAHQYFDTTRTCPCKVKARTKPQQHKAERSSCILESER